MSGTTFTFGAIMDQHLQNFGTTYPAIVGKVLADLRVRQGMAQKDMASAVGVTQANWSRIESGQTSVTLEHLRSAAKVLAIPPAQILAIADQTEIEASVQGVAIVEAKSALDLHPGLVLLAGATLGLFVTYAIMKSKS
jgi:transcriptional regulator with XRE-family HTH domain